MRPAGPGQGQGGGRAADGQWAWAVAWVRTYPPPPLLRKHGLVQATEWALNRRFQGFFGTAAFCVVLNAGLGVCDALVEGKEGSFMSAMVLLFITACATHDNAVRSVLM